MVKLGEKYRGAVFVGYSPYNNAYLRGTWVKTETGRVQWMDFETEGAKFVEDVLVGDLKWLKPDAKGLHLPYNVLDTKSLEMPWRCRKRPSKTEQRQVSPQGFCCRQSLTMPGSQSSKSTRDFRDCGYEIKKIQLCAI